MGKLKIKLMPDGTLKAETKGIKGKKCLDYVQILSQLADIKIDKMQMSSDYYQQDSLVLDDVQNLSDN